MDDTKDQSEDHLSFLKDLRRLPDEVLVEVFQMLPPHILFLLLDSTSWVKQIVCSIRFLSCQEYPFINHNILKSLMKSIGPNLRKLYLDNLVSLTSSQLSALICRCKNLKVLSIQNTGIDLPHICSILQKLQLEVFSFTIDSTDVHPIKLMQKAHDIPEQKLKKIHIGVGNILLLNYFMHCFLPFCQELTEVRLTFSVYNDSMNFVTNLPNILKERPQLNLPNLDALTIAWPVRKGTCVDFSMINLYATWKEEYLIPMLESAITCRTDEIKWKRFWFIDSFPLDDVLKKWKVTLQGLHSASCLFISEDQVDWFNLKILKKFPQNSLQQFGFHTSEIKQHHIECIEYAGGINLKQLAAISSNHVILLEDADLLNRLMKTCFNISDLDISQIHVAVQGDFSVCAAISQLKGLRRLCIPTCAVESNPNNDAETLPTHILSSSASTNKRRRICTYNTLRNNDSVVFSQMVQACTDVEDFYLTECPECGVNVSTRFESIYENIISDVHLWKRLKHLRLHNIRSMRLITFVETVAENCEEFASLHLVNIGHEQVFHFMPSIIKVLKLSKALKFLRIIHNSFKWSVVAFWEAVGCAKSLQGLCITSNSKASYISMKSVLKEIAKLPYFHVFHLHDSGFCLDHTFCNQMRKALSRAPHRMVSTNNISVIYHRSKFDHVRRRIVEPNCHIFHPGIRDNSTKGPWFS